MSGPGLRVGDVVEHLQRQRQFQPELAATPGIVFSHQRERLPVERDRLALGPAQAGPVRRLDQVDRGAFPFSCLEPVVPDGRRRIVLAMQLFEERGDGSMRVAALCPRKRGVGVTASRYRGKVRTTCQRIRT